MTRINSNVSSLVAQNRLQTSNSDLQSALTRLSTGLRINSGADDPAGLIASEALRSEITGLNKAISNTQRASQIISTADSALGQVSSLLNDVRGLVVEAANSGALSDEEIAANQLQIDSSLEAINRIAQTTTFQGRKLLDGSQDFVSTVGSVSSIRDANIEQAKLGGSSLSVEVVVSSAASQAEATASASAFTTAASASADSAQGRVGTSGIGGETITITGDADFTTVTHVTNAADGAGAVSYNSTTGELTISADFGATGAADAQVIQAQIDALDGFVATGATASTAGTGTDDADGAAAAADELISISAVNSGSDYNDVTINFVAGGANAADFDSEQKILTVTVDSSGPQTAAAIATAIGSHTVDGAAATALFNASGIASGHIDINNEFSSLTTAKTGGEVLADDLVFQLNGSSGAETFNFASGTSKDQIASAINLVSDSTGVAAAVASGSLTLTSTDYGSDALVSVDVINEGASGTFAANLDTTRDTGTDIVATVNGVEATGQANTLSINTSSLDLSLTVDDGSSTNFSFDISGGGATFQLGPEVSSTQQASLGIGSVSTGQLGGAAGRLYELGSGQSKSLANDVTGAAQIIDQVIAKVTGLRGRLGAFQSTTLESNLVSLNDTKANLQEAESSIRDADFAQESARLTRAQILVQSGTNVLSLANQNPQNVLALLR
jgi:flagellin